jgi:hypothetical protein
MTLPIAMSRWWWARTINVCKLVRSNDMRLRRRPHLKVAAAARCGNRGFGDQPSRREAMISETAQRNDVGSVGRRFGKKISPRAHQPVPLVEQIAAPMGRLDLVADDVGKGSLDTFRGCISRRFSRPRR